jgi:hypothetical protein
LLEDYGFGIYIYFKLLWNLICLFGFFSLIGLFLMNFYHSHSGYKGIIIKEDYKFLLTTTSLGNIGFSEAKCYHQLMGFNRTKPQKI